MFFRTPQKAVAARHKSMRGRAYPEFSSCGLLLQNGREPCPESSHGDARQDLGIGRCKINRVYLRTAFSITWNESEKSDESIESPRQHRAASLGPLMLSQLPQHGARTSDDIAFISHPNQLKPVNSKTYNPVTIHQSNPFRHFSSLLNYIS
jgi:hypothetical protein